MHLGDQRGIVFSREAVRELGGRSDLHEVFFRYVGYQAQVLNLAAGEGAILDGTFEGGKVDSLGLVSDVPAENFVQIAPSTQFSDSFTEADYEALVAAMNAGKVTVSNDIAAEPAVTVVTVDYQGNIK